MGVLAAPNPEIAMLEIGVLFEHGALLGAVVRRQQHWSCRSDRRGCRRGHARRTGPARDRRPNCCPRRSAALPRSQMSCRRTRARISSTGSWNLSELKMRALATLLGSAARTSPPGRATRIISSMAAPGSGVWIKTVWQVTRSKLASANGSFLGDGDPIAEAVGKPVCGGARGSLFDPKRIAINALHPRARSVIPARAIDPNGPPHNRHREHPARDRMKASCPLAQESRDSTNDRAFRRNTRPSENPACEIRWPSSTRLVAGKRAGS